MLSSCSNCTRCEFHHHTHRPGIGGRSLREGGFKSAILIVGQSPGWREEREGRVFIGRSGDLLMGRMTGGGYLACLSPNVDVWATNAVRCRPPKDIDPKVTQIKACAVHLQADFQQMLDRYDTVYVLCLGAIATRAVLKKTLQDSFRGQGTLISKLPYHPDPLPRPVPVYSTYHPAWFLRDPKKSKEAAIEDHLRRMTREIECAPVEEAGQGKLWPTVERVGFGKFFEMLRGVDPEVVRWLDIETYGIRPDREQTQFNPYASAAIDGVPIGKQIESIALAYDAGDRVVATAELWTPRVRQLVSDFLTYPGLGSGRPLGGTNLLFDLSYLCAEFPAWFPMTNVLWDTCILSFMDNPDRPEGSLKDLSPLLLPSYLYEKYGERNQRYADDDSLLEYNIKDVVNPAYLAQIFLDRMRERGAPPDPLLTIRFYSLVTRVLLHMGLEGVEMDRAGAEEHRRRTERRCGKLTAGAMDRWGLLVAGTGSGTALKSLFRDIVEHCPRGPAGGWDKTPKKGAISTGQSNINRAAIADVPDELRRQALALRHFRDQQKLLTTYYRPLEKLLASSTRVWPHWFPVPSRFESNEGSYAVTGGTRQARVSCKKPALQTAPKRVRKLMRHRYPGGFMAKLDFSQLEMRVAAMVSGDPALLQVYREGRDIHQETLDFVMGRHVEKTEPNYERMRRGAKVGNFGSGLYRGGGGVIQEILWKKERQWMPDVEAAKFKHGFDQKYAGYVRWCGEQLQKVREAGRLVLPISGQWLSFYADPRNPDKAIFNFWIQAFAANITLTGHWEVIQWLWREKVGVAPLSIHDSVFVDCRWPVSRAEELQDALRPLLCDSWYAKRLRELYGPMDFPVDFEVVSA